VHQHGGRAVREDGVQLGRGEAPVQGHEDGAEAEAGELGLKNVGAVLRQHGDARPGSDAAGVPQVPRKGGGTPVEVEVGETPAGGQVHGRRRAGPARGVVGDPVVVRVGHRGRLPAAHCVAPAGRGRQESAAETGRNGGRG
jgi:hypothetical protein